MADALPLGSLPAVVHLASDGGWAERSPGDSSHPRWLADVSEGWCPGIAGDLVTMRDYTKGILHNVAHPPCRLRPVVDEEGFLWGECPVTGIWIRLEPDLQKWTSQCVARTTRRRERLEEATDAR